VWCEGLMCEFVRVALVWFCGDDAVEQAGS